MCASGQGSGPSLLPGASAKAIKPLLGSCIPSFAPHTAPELESPRIAPISSESTRTSMVLTRHPSATQRLGERRAATECGTTLPARLLGLKLGIGSIARQVPVAILIG